jgi:hypothetical protein
VIAYDWHFGIMAGLSVDVEVMALLLMQAYEVASHRADQGTGLEKRPKKRSKGSAERGDKEGELLQMSRMDGALRRQQAPIRSEVSVGGERVQVDSLKESLDHETANGKILLMYEYLPPLHSADCLNFPAIAF